MDLIIHDEYLNEISSYFEEQEEYLSQAIDAYIEIMKAVKVKGIMQGETSDALEEFINQIEMSGSNIDRPDDLADRVKNYLTNFINKVDKADKHLY